MKATAQEYDFHARLCARGDPTAFAELAEWLYQPLILDVQRRAGSYADSVLIEEAVGQALLDYHERPHSYQPDRGSLRGYLTMVAYRDFQNAQAKEQRLKGGQISLFDPAFQEHDIIGRPGAMDDDGEVEELWAKIDATFPDPIDRQVVELVMNHVRALEPFVDLLHLSHLPENEQVRQVRRVKYRVTRRLRRTMTRQLSFRGDA